jgi:membrane associated rhomboid family serine protease
MFVLQWFAANLMGRSGGLDPLADLLGLRAWIETGPTGGPSDKVFNLFFPVQLVTYMVVHSLSLSHVGFNMLYLWFFGRELEATMGKQGFLRFYITGGVVGGLAQWVLNMTQGDAFPVVGASGAVYAVLALYALKWPRRTMIIFPILIPIPVIFILGFKVVGDLMGFLEGAPGVAFLAHLGGAAVGLLWFRRGDVVARAQDTVKRKRNEKVLAAESDDRREMDRILRKIQASGLTSLTPEERSFLDRRSKELRERSS